MKYPKTDVFSERVEQLASEELLQPVALWYLSFAEPKPVGWLGAVIVSAPGFSTAIQLTHKLGVNPGGQVQGMRIPDEGIPDDKLNKLLTLDECKQLFGEMVSSKTGENV